MKKIPKEKRQIEILALAEQETITVADVCSLFNVEVASIHRDLRELREQGIGIHSTKQGIKISKPLVLSDYNKILSRYLTFSGDVLGYPKNISLTTKKLKTKSLHIFISIVTAIEQRKQLNITYTKYYSGETVTRVIEPYQLVPTSRNWRLVAWSNGYFKQFLVENILEIKILSSTFKRAKDFDVKNIYKTSFEIWGSDDEFDVSLLFNADAGKRIVNGVWSEEQEIETLKSGKVRLMMKVNSIEQVGDWVLTWGGNVIVEKPKGLKQYVVEMAKGILHSNH